MMRKLWMIKSKQKRTNNRLSLSDLSVRSHKTSIISHQSRFLRDDWSSCSNICPARLMLLKEERLFFKLLALHEVQTIREQADAATKLSNTVPITKMIMFDTHAACVCVSV